MDFKGFSTVCAKTIKNFYLVLLNWVNLVTFTLKSEARQPRKNPRFHLLQLSTHATDVIF